VITLDVNWVAQSSFLILVLKSQTDYWWPWVIHQFKEVGLFLFMYLFLRKCNPSQI